jgi:DNA-binding response OmpR family regulator
MKQPGTQRSGLARGRDPILLFVDDEPEVLSALRRCFRHEPYLVFTAGGPGEAFAWLEKTPIDLVITDERMPEMSGTDFLREVRKRSPRTVRGLLTGYPSETVIQKGLEAGADALLYKPWDDQSLRGKIRGLLEKGARGGRCETRTEQSTERSFDMGGEGG